jgi:peptidoglycan hydrolase-like protein with peptidoglycan-binding domain
MWRTSGGGVQRLGTLVCGLALAVTVAGCAGGAGRAASSATAPAAPGTAPATSGTAPATSSPVVSSPAAPAASSPVTVTSSPTAPARSPSGTVDALLRPGTSGPRVMALQRRLSELGYWLGTPDGSYGDLTAQAVLAAQKAAGLGRDGVAGRKTLAALDAGTRPQPRSTSGHVIEVDLAHQLLLVVDGGQVTRVLNTSTGSGAYYTAADGHTAHATTPTGSFRAQWQIDAWHTSDLGRLYRPKFFHPRGIAVHGALSVPAYPASHGCVRVSVPAMDMLWGQNLMPIGTSVQVF